MYMYIHITYDVSHYRILLLITSNNHRDPGSNLLALNLVPRAGCVVLTPNLTNTTPTNIA